MSYQTRLRIRKLVAEIQKLAKEEWGTEYLDCDCGHSKEFCKCDCFMCINGWKLTEYLEIHEWERKLLPIVTSREPMEIKEESDDKSQR